jgi:hypothetical protein
MTTRFILGLSCGAAFALAAMLACSDDAPGAVDAADGGRCDCPAAEPPLANRIVRITGSAREVLPVARGGASTACAPGAIALGGSCTLAAGADLSQIRLIEAGHPADGPNAWNCEWFNSGNAAVTAVAAVNCYIPPAQ